MEERSSAESALRVELRVEFGGLRVEVGSEEAVDDVRVAEELVDWKCCYRCRR